jgi:endo-1,4-beta-xylanase
MKTIPVNHSPSFISRRTFVRNTALSVAALSILKVKAFAAASVNTGLKDYYKDDFHIGAALSDGIFMNNDQEMLDFVAREFNSITAENAMKWERVHPRQDEWRFEIPDRLVEFGQKHDMHLLGHVLVWHSQVPKDLFKDGEAPVSREVFTKRMENHIQTLVDRYKGKIHAWDVVNESITPEDGWRKSPWLEIMGPEFMDRAFHLAHEADPKCHLLYNDYGMDNVKRRNFVVQMVKDFQKKGVPIHGIGMQGHYNIDGPPISEIEASIEAFASTGLRVHFTELDVDVLPYNWARTAEISTNIEYAKSLNPYVDGLPKEVNDKLTKRYEDLFRLFIKHRDKLDRITFWGTTDANSWKNNFPMRGRTNYPLLFDRQSKPKDAYHAVVALKKSETR